MWDILSSVLDGERGGKSLARCRSTAANCLYAIDLPQVAGSAGDGNELQPRHGGLTLLAPWSIRRGRGSTVFGAVGMPKLLRRDVEVKERGGRASEVMTAADYQVGRIEFGGGFGGRQVELHSNLPETPGQVWIGGSDA